MNQINMQNDLTKVTFSQVYQDFKEALSGAADALKTGSEHVYGVLVRQQIVNSISLIITILVLTTASYFAFKFVNRKSIKDGLEDTEPGAVFAVIGVAILIIGTIGFTASHTVEIVTGFVNPEYGAIQEVREFIR
jgi:hypothetical protein